MSQRAPYLPGYVSIDSQTADGVVVVVGKQWTRHYDTALDLAGKAGGVVASRHWVAQKQSGEDPVTKHSLAEVVPSTDQKKRGGR